MVDGNLRAVGRRDFAFDPFGLLELEAVEDGSDLFGAGEHRGVLRSAVAVLEVGVVVRDDQWIVDNAPNVFPNPPRVTEGEVVATDTT